MAHGGEEVALEPVHLEQGEVGLGELVDLLVEVRIDLAELLLHGDKVVEHAVEGVRQLLELITGVDLAADVELAGGDGVGDVAQVLDGLDDDVSDDDVRGDHRQDGGDKRGRDQNGPVAVDVLVRLVHREPDGDGGGQVVGAGHHVLAGSVGAGLVVVAADHAVGLEEHGLDILVLVVILAPDDPPVEGGGPVGKGGGLADGSELVLARFPGKGAKEPGDGLGLEGVSGLVVLVAGVEGQDQVGVIARMLIELGAVVGPLVHEGRKQALAGEDLLGVEPFQDRADGQAGGLGFLANHQALGLLAVPEEAEGDEDQDAASEDEATLAFEAGLAKQMLEGAIRHEAPSGTELAGGAPRLARTLGDRSSPRASI